MASPSCSNKRKRHRQISIVGMYKIPKDRQSLSGSTNNKEHDTEAQLDFEQ